MAKSHYIGIAAAAAAVGGALIARGLRASHAIDFRDRSVLITSGSRGLGLLIARQLGRQGARLTLAARDAEGLDRARADLKSRGIDVSIDVCDLRRRNESERLVRGVIARTGGIDVLVNNAGTMHVGPLDHMQVSNFEEAMAVHFWAPLNAMLAAIPDMRRRGGGRIVNISSIGGRIGIPHLVPYCASKFALTGLSDSMRAELAKDGIRVTTVCPGLMRTGSPFNAWFKGRHREEFTWFAVSDSIPVLSISAERGVAGDRCVPPRRRRAGNHLAGAARHRRQCRRPGSGGARNEHRGSPSAGVDRRRRRAFAQRLAEPVELGALEAYAADGSGGSPEQ